LVPREKRDRSQGVGRAYEVYQTLILPSGSLPRLADGNIWEKVEVVPRGDWASRMLSHLKEVLGVFTPTWGCHPHSEGSSSW